jgi:hypothetical protein
MSQRFFASRLTNRNHPDFMDFLQILTLFDGKILSALSELQGNAEKENLSIGSGNLLVSFAAGEGVVD